MDALSVVLSVNTEVEGMAGEVYVNVVEYGVFSYPDEIMKDEGWRFMRIEYHNTDQSYAFLEHHVWMPPLIGSGELEDFMNEKIAEYRENT